ncbi:hypothetical protein ACXPWS_09205 [Mycobacterium sp. BMJ-28]
MSKAESLVALIVGSVALVGLIVGGLKWVGGESSQAENHPDIAGWGPDRETFTIENPAPRPVLNSIVNNPAYGDTRNFAHVRLADFTNATYADNVSASPGDVIVLYAVVANDCADNVCAEGDNLMRGLEMSLDNPSRGTQLPFSVHVRAANAQEVWDGATVRATAPARLELVDNSCTMHSADESFPLDSGALSRGGWMKLGEFKQDGEYPVGRTPTGMV